MYMDFGNWETNSGYFIDGHLEMNSIPLEMIPEHKYLTHVMSSRHMRWALDT